MQHSKPTSKCVFLPNKVIGLLMNYFLIWQLVLIVGTLYTVVGWFWILHVTDQLYCGWLTCVYELCFLYLCIVVLPLGRQQITLSKACVKNFFTRMKTHELMYFLLISVVHTLPLGDFPISFPTTVGGPCPSGLVRAARVLAVSHH